MGQMPAAGGTMTNMFGHLDMEPAGDTSLGDAPARGDEEDELQDLEQGLPANVSDDDDDEGEDDEFEDDAPPPPSKKDEAPVVEGDAPAAPAAKREKPSDEEIERLRNEHEAMIARIDEIVANGGVLPTAKPEGDDEGDEDDDDEPGQPELDDIMKGRVSAQLRPFKMKSEDAQRLGIPEKQVPHHEAYINMMTGHIINEMLPVVMRANAPLIHRVTANLSANMKRVEAFLTEYPELDSPRSRNIVNFAMGLALTEAREKKMTDEGEILKLARVKYAETLGQANQIAEQLGKTSGSGKVVDGRTKKGGKPAGAGTRGTARRQPAPPDNRNSTQRAMDDIRSADESPTKVAAGSPFAHLFGSRR